MMGLHRTVRVLSLVAGMGVVSLTGASCGSSEEPEGGNADAGEMPHATSPGRYRGLVSGGSFTGVLDISVGSDTTAKARPKATGSGASGTLTSASGGTPIALSGSWDPASGTLELSGGGFTFSGTGDGLAISGTYTGPAGSGAFALLAASEARVSVFCGSFGGDGQGTWNVAAVEGGAASGAFASADGSSVGTFMGTWLSGELTLHGSGIDAHGPLSATGGMGTWIAGSSGGSWTGEPCGGESGADDAGTEGSGESDAGTSEQPGDDMPGGDGPTVTGPGIAPGTCVPIEAGSCSDPQHPYAYLCAQGGVLPEADCVGAGASKCCAHPYCVRQEGSEYACEIQNQPPYSFMCWADAPIPSSCKVNAGASSAVSRYCCP